MRRPLPSRPLLGIALLLALAPSARGEDAGTLQAVVTVRGDDTLVVWPEVQTFLVSRRDGLVAQASRAPREGDGVLCVYVVLSGPAQALPEALASQVQALDRHLAQLHAGLLARIDARSAELERRLADVDGAIADLRERLLAGAPEVTAAALLSEALLTRRLEVAARLDEALLERRALALRRASLEERLRGLLATAAPAEALPAWDVVLRTREQAVVQLRGRVEAGTLDPLDLLAAEEALARARIERAEFLAAAADDPLAERRREVQDALAQATLEGALLEATTAHWTEVGQRLDQALREGRAASVGLTALERQRDVLRDLLADLARRQLDAAPPQVSVLRFE